MDALGDRVTDLLRQEILSGGLGDGQELTQEALAARLGVSRLPVREALVRLEDEGLVERLPSRRVRVAGLTPVRIAQNLRVLAALEGEIARLALAGGHTGVVEEAFGRCSDAARGDRAGFARADRAFHLSLSAALDNPALRTLHESRRRVLFESLVPEPDPDLAAPLDAALGQAFLAGAEEALRQAVFAYYTRLAPGNP